MVQKDFKKSKNIDIIKGIGIILVVLGHAYFPLRKYIYLFHVAVFFMTAGYCNNEKYSSSLLSFIELFIKRVKSLWVPYMIYNLIFLLFQNILIKFHIYTDDYQSLSMGFLSNDGFISIIGMKDAIVIIMKSVFFINSRPLLGGLWFLGGLFYVTILYNLIDLILVKLKIKKLHIIISIVLLLIGFFISKGTISIPFFGKFISIVFSCEILFLVGVALKDHMSKIMNKPLLILVLSCSILIILSHFGSISIGSTHFVNPLFFLSASVVGFVFLWSLSIFILRVELLEKVFIYIGVNTIPILALHILSFKIITLIQMHVFNESALVISALPVWKFDSYWWLLYSIVGVSLPLFINKIFTRIRNYVFFLGKNLRMKITSLKR